ncbi:MAG: MFS transporter [Christensenellaceae bacterium]|jgi:oligogalacturonide transporter|nr:MFS transporter [Christensenellaceae bacterium]
MAEKITTVEKKKSSLGRIVAYGFADTMAGTSSQIITLYYLVFLVAVQGMSPLLAGIAVGFGRIWDGMIDPFMGVLVEKTRSKFGSSRFLMTIAVIPVAICFFLLWNGFNLFRGNDILLLVYYIIAYMLWTTAFSMVQVPYEAMLPKIASGYQERTNFSSVRMIFSGVGAVSATWLFDVIVKYDDAVGPTAANMSQYGTMALLFGVVFSIPIFITILGVKEPSSLNNPFVKLSVSGIYKSYAKVLRSRTYRKFFLLVVLGSFVSASVTTAMQFLVLLLYGNISNYILTFTLTFIVVNLKGAIEIGFFIPNLLMMKKTNKHRPYLIDIPFLIISGIIIWFASPAMPIPLFIVAMMFLGAGVSCLGYVPMTLLPDLTDVQEAMYGNKAEGETAGLYTFAKQVVGGVAILSFGLVLEAFGLKSGTDLSPVDSGNAPSLMAVKVMFSILPVVCCVLIFIISKTYKLNGESHSLIKRLVTEKREKGIVKATEDEIVTIEKITGVKRAKMWLFDSETAKLPARLPQTK